jgi:beta-glucanase (GH16 family)
MWPAIWMMGTDREHLGWPGAGEIDIMEFVGKEPDAIHGTVHFQKDNKPAESGEEITRQNPSDGFHIYAIEWSPDQIKFFYDDQLYHTFAVKDADNKTGNPFHRPEYLLFNLALGGSWGGELDDSALPAQLLIDYVRVYRKGPTTQPAK